MKFAWSITLLLAFGSAGWAQQSQNGTASTTLPLVQAAGGTSDRPGGISYVTRRRSMAGNINLANSFWAAGGVQVVTATGVAGASSATQFSPGVASAIPAPQQVTDPRALTALRQLAARGDATAKRVLASMAGAGN